MIPIGISKSSYIFAVQHSVHDCTCMMIMSGNTHTRLMFANALTKPPFRWSSYQCMLLMVTKTLTYFIWGKLSTGQWKESMCGNLIMLSQRKSLLWWKYVILVVGCNFARPRVTVLLFQDVQKEYEKKGWIMHHGHDHDKRKVDRMRRKSNPSHRLLPHCRMAVKWTGEWRRMFPCVSRRVELEGPSIQTITSTFFCQPKVHCTCSTAFLVNILRGLVQTIGGNHNVIVVLGGEV